MIELQLKKELNFALGKKLLQVEASIEEGSCVAIMGPSGSGKTTLLRLVSGLTDALSGTIKVGNQTWLDTSNKINWPTQKRNIGYVFQDYALFPNMTVQQNLGYALEKHQSAQIVTELMEVMGLQNLSNKYPNTLSGGQQQRVALARALVRKPQILLLDEPLSALEEELRSELQAYILKLHEAYHLTTILVSHDKKEITKMAQQVFVLEEGRIIHTGTPEQVFPNAHQLQQLVGIIEKIEPCLENVLLHVKIGDNQFTLPSSKEAAHQLKIKDQLLINTSMSTWKTVHK